MACMEAGELADQYIKQNNPKQNYFTKQLNKIKPRINDQTSSDDLPRFSSSILFSISVCVLVYLQAKWTLLFPLWRQSRQMPSWLQRAGISPMPRRGVSLLDNTRDPSRRVTSINMYDLCFKQTNQRAKNEGTCLHIINIGQHQQCCTTRTGWGCKHWELRQRNNTSKETWLFSNLPVSQTQRKYTYILLFTRPVGLTYNKQLYPQILNYIRL